MADKGLTGPAAKKLAALVRELNAEPSKADQALYVAWRDAVVSRAMALFRLIGKKAVMVHMAKPHAERLAALLGEAAAVASEARLASTTAS